MTYIPLQGLAYLSEKDELQIAEQILLGDVFESSSKAEGLSVGKATNGQVRDGCDEAGEIISEMATKILALQTNVVFLSLHASSYWTSSSFFLSHNFKYLHASYS